MYSVKGRNGTPLFDVQTHQIKADELHPLLRIMDVFIQALLDMSVAHDQHSIHEICHQDGLMVRNLVKTIERCWVRFNVWEDKREGDVLLGHF